MNGWYVNPVGGTWLVVAVSTAFLALLMLAGRDLRGLSPGRRGALIGLRVLVFLAIVAGMLRPTYVFTEMKRHRATVIVLVDRTKSMSVPDEGNKTRWDRLREVVDAALPKFRDLNEDLDVKFYTFDATINSVPLNSDNLDLGATAEGTQTAIGAAMADTLRKETGHRIAGMILLSDGGQNAMDPRDLAPQTAVRQLADLGVPLYTVCFGKEGSEERRDAAVVAIDAPRQTFVKNAVPIKGRVRIRGYRGQDIPVQALFEVEAGKEPVLVGTQNVRAVRDGEDLPVEFSYIPQVAGEHKITLRIPPQSEEQDTSNNETSTYVQVSAGGLNVFYIEGEPRVEQRFLRRSLGASPDIKVDFKWFDHRDRKNWPVKDIGEQFKPGKYDVYILGDIDSKAFQPSDLASLRLAVERGAGLIMLGGFHSFWAGGYQDTALREILPLAPDRAKFDRQGFDEPIREEMHLKPANRDVGLKMLPDKKFGNISVMRLAPGDDQNRAAWLRLPGLEGANLFPELKLAAKPLAVTPDGRPLLVAGEPGAGRVLAFAGDSTWHWYMEGFEAEHKRFWRQVVLWLAKKEDVEKNGVWVRLPQRQYMPHRPVEFTVGAATAQGDPIAGATFEASVTLPNGSRAPVRMSRVGNQATGAFRETLGPGEYAIQIVASKDKAVLGEAHTRFMVYEQDLEMENPGAMTSFMASLSAITKDYGGRSYPPENLTDICDALKRQSKDLEVPTETKTTPWDKPPLFLAIVGLLVVEWYLRKKWGLV